MKIDLKRAIEVLTACGYECHEIDALQADNARLRDALKHSVLYVPDLATVPGIAAALAANPEQSLARLRNQVLDEAINVAWNHEPDCNGPIEMALRKLKGKHEHQ